MPIAKTVVYGVDRGTLEISNAKLVVFVDRHQVNRSTSRGPILASRRLRNQGRCLKLGNASGKKVGLFTFGFRWTGGTYSWDCSVHARVSGEPTKLSGFAYRSKMNLRRNCLHPCVGAVPLVLGNCRYALDTFTFSGAYCPEGFGTYTPQHSSNAYMGAGNDRLAYVPIVGTRRMCTYDCPYDKKS